MATDTFLLDRMRNLMISKGMDWEEKKMFGGICFMVDDKMCFGTFRGGLMVRTEPEETEDLVAREGAEQMELTGRVMKGYISLQEEAYDEDTDLEFWIQKALDFNPKAKSSKKKVNK